MKLKSLSVATFNLLNLNLPGQPIYTDADGWSREEFDRKVAWTAQQLVAIDADVVGLQELWHREALDAVLDAADLSAAYDAVVPADANGRRIVCAALVRKGLLDGEPSWIERFPDGLMLRSSGDDPQTPAIAVKIDRFSRPVLHLRIRPRSDEPSIHVYVCHFKSKAPTRIDRERWFREREATFKPHVEAIGAALSTIRRTAEAAALRVLLDATMRGNDDPVIVLGDINDGQHSNTANILTGQPRYLVGDSRGGGDGALYTAQTLQEYRDTRDVYYTHVFQDIRESLDHVLVSEQLYDNSRRRRWMFAGLAIRNDHLDDPQRARSGSGDHGVVRAVFEHRPVKRV